MWLNYWTGEEQCGHEQGFSSSSSGVRDSSRSKRQLSPKTTSDGTRVHMCTMLSGRSDIDIVSFLAAISAKRGRRFANGPKCTHAHQPFFSQPPLILSFVFDRVRTTERNFSFQIFHLGRAVYASSKYGSGEDRVEGREVYPPASLSFHFDSSLFMSRPNGFKDYEDGLIPSAVVEQSHSQAMCSYRLGWIPNATIYDRLSGPIGS